MKGGKRHQKKSDKKADLVTINFWISGPQNRGTHILLK